MLSKFSHSLAHLFHPRKSNSFRPRLLHPEAIFIIVLALSGLLFLGEVIFRFVHPLGLILGYASNINVSQVVARTNQERQLAGIEALVYNQKLALAASAKAEDMFKNQYWAHRSPSGKEPWDFMEKVDYKYQTAGENLARDFSATDSMVEAWMDSPTHRANIVNPRYKEIGVAVVDGVLDGVETTLVVQMFGAQPNSQPTLVSAPPAKTISLTQEEAGWQVYDQADLSAAGNNQLGVMASGEVTAVLSRETSKKSESWWLVAYSPQQIVKSLFLSLIMILIITLIYDLYAIGHHQNVRVVGKNLAHIFFLGAIGFIVILYKSGSIG